MKRTGKGGNQKMPGGFTLLEVLLAIFIFAFVVSAIFTAYTGTFKIIDETESQAGIYEMARIALERISEDLASAYLSGQPMSPAAAEDLPNVLFVGEKKEIGGQPCCALRFSSLAHIAFSKEVSVAGPTEIAYYAAAKGDEGPLDLYRSDIPLGRERPEPGTGGLLLCEGLSSIGFIYYDSDGEPHDSWNAGEGISKGKLPSRVSILIEFANSTDPAKPFRFLTGVAIPMGG